MVKEPSLPGHTCLFRFGFKAEGTADKRAAEQVKTEPLCRLSSLAVWPSQLGGAGVCPTVVGTSSTHQDLLSTCQLSQGSAPRGTPARRKERRWQEGNVTE